MENVTVEYQNWWRYPQEKDEHETWDFILALLTFIAGAFWIAFIMFKLMH